MLAVASGAKSKQGWLDAVRQDIQWIMDNSPVGEAFRAMSWHQWIQYFAAEPKCAKNLFKRACVHPRLVAAAGWAKTRRLEQLDPNLVCELCQQRDLAEIVRKIALASKDVSTAMTRVIEPTSGGRLGRPTDENQ